MLYVAPPSSQVLILIRWLCWNAYYTLETARQHVDKNAPPVVIDPVNPTNNVAPNEDSWKVMAVEARKTLAAFKELDTTERMLVVEEKVNEIRKSFVDDFQKRAYVSPRISFSPSIFLLIISLGRIIQHEDSGGTLMITRARNVIMPRNISTVHPL